MKVWKFFAVVPLITVSLRAAPAASDLALPVRMLPGLDGILKTAVQQSPRMLSQALDLEIAENNRIVAPVEYSGQPRFFLQLLQGE